MILKLNELTAISPIDGRYRNKTEALDKYFSEYALICYRVYVEVEYFIALVKEKLPPLKYFNQKDFQKLRNIYINITLEDAQRIKELERTTNHDVKAVEYFLKEKFAKYKWEKFSEFIHFALTSQDINNTAIPASFKDAINNEYFPKLFALNELLIQLSKQWKNIPMLARTHGQPASPTTLGKEIYVYFDRLISQRSNMGFIFFAAKFGGATGNFNAHKIAYPKKDWKKFADKFVNETLELHRSEFTTQIEHYDNLAAHFDCMKRINNILIDLCRDMWTYISMDYFKQKIKKGEIGSSAMPHKVNPIDFENAEGNFGVANALFEHLSSKLPVSRLQRDLTDSTVLRNIGVPFAHTMIGFESLMKGLNKLVLNEAALKIDLENNWAVVAEAIQTILRREGYPKPYEALKELTRKNEKISKSSIHEFIDSLNVNSKIKKELKAISPSNYTGYGLD